MARFHWTVRFSDDPHDPVITGEQPLFFRGEAPSLEDAIKRTDTYVFFPLCWQACLVGNLMPFPNDIERFAPDKLRSVRHMICSLSTDFVVSPQRIEF